MAHTRDWRTLCMAIEAIKKRACFLSEVCFTTEKRNPPHPSPLPRRGEGKILCGLRGSYVTRSGFHGDGVPGANFQAEGAACANVVLHIADHHARGDGGVLAHFDDAGVVGGDGDTGLAACTAFRPYFCDRPGPPDRRGGSRWRVHRSSIFLLPCPVKLRALALAETGPLFPGHSQPWAMAERTISAQASASERAW